MKRNALTYLLLPFLLALLVTACKDDTLPASPAEEEEAGSGVYVSVVVNTGGSNASRVPTPGEDGDLPKEPGTGDENMVHDLNVFFFQGDDGINSSNAENIDVECLFFNEDELQYYGKDSENNYDAIYSVTKEVSAETNLQIGQTYNVLVIANYGRDMSLVLSQNKLAELRDLSHLAMTEDNEDGHHFLMASAGPETNRIIIENTNSPYNPSTVTVDVERLAARIDIHLNENGEYTPVDYPQDKAKITGMTIVNAYKEPSYLFKRTVQDAVSTPVYLGNETTDDNGLANNYVTDPQTISADKTDADFDNYFPDMIWGSYQHWDMPNENTDYTSTDQEGRTYYRLGYVQENVMFANDINTEAERERLCTGITFQIEYTNNTTFGSEHSITSTFYKTYWIKHADDRDVNSTGVMEYAIVRNNIYQINVENISGRENDLNITVTTKDWTKKTGSTIEWN